MDHLINRGLARGVIGDAFGNWVVGFSSVIDFTTSVMVEQSVLRDGLVMAKKTWDCEDSC